MKKLLIAIFTISLCSCAGILSKKDVFIGDWVIAERSPSLEYDFPLMKKNDEISIKIIKGDIFYIVSFIINNKIEGPSLNKYQLSPDRRFLIAIDKDEPIQSIIYNEDNKTITCSFGWFKKK